MYCYHFVCHFPSLDSELQFIRDPYTTFDQLKSLRLICRSFNHVASPRVLSCVSLLGRRGDTMDDILDNMRQLCAIISSDLHGHLHVTHTLVACGWHLTFQALQVGDAMSIHLLAFLYLPKILPMYIYCRLRTRYRLSGASAFNIPNVQRVV